MKYSLTECLLDDIACLMRHRRCIPYTFRMESLGVIKDLIETLSSFFRKESIQPGFGDPHCTDEPKQMILLDEAWTPVCRRSLFPYG